MKKKRECKVKKTTFNLFYPSIKRMRTGILAIKKYTNTLKKKKEYNSSKKL